jgi:tetratricopeptide (TPR) repeat protein
MPIRFTSIQQLSRKLDGLEKRADCGDFRGTSEVLTFDRTSINRLFKSIGHIERAPLAASLAKFYFYFGEDETAKQLLEPYATLEDTFLGLKMQAGQYLQLSEYYLCQRKFEKAAIIATKILDRSLRTEDHLGVAECCYYLSRCYARMGMGRHKNLDELRDVALSNLGKIEDSRKNRHRIKWRMGLMFLANGFGQWKAGNPMKGEADLYAAQWLLSRSDQRAMANCRQALANIIRARSSSPKDYEISLSKLKEARTEYEAIGHDFFQARVMADIGRTHLRMSNWPEAHKSLDEALEVVEKQTGKTDPARYKRQKAEILQWKAAVLLEEPSDDSRQSLKDAEEYLQEARKLADEVNSKTGLADICIFLGHIRMKQNRNGAKEFFGTAIEIATDHDLVKSRINAHLSLAEYYATDRPAVTALKSAVDHYETAKDLIGPYTSCYLKDKAAAVEKLLVRHKGSYFFLSADQLGRQGMDSDILLKKAVRDFRMWCVRAVMARCKNNVKKAAEELGVTEAALRRYTSNADDSD